CPDPDNDKDGFLDAVDKCPDAAEIFNGFEDDDGCPDQGPALAVMTGSKIEITQQVNFATNKAVIQKSSFKLLATVAKIMTLHPELSKITVEGHTDNSGVAQKNMKLSQDRADAVRQHLVEVNGIEPARLESVGFGPNKPIASNATRKGRAQNRRVEFVWTR
ncbi:MAG TPA: OmpA family protein, partial [Polyangia bacterium]|nr:OmpA family protein [Polyangia bacterium]